MVRLVRESAATRTLQVIQLEVCHERKGTGNTTFLRSSLSRCVLVFTNFYVKVSSSVES
jgi:hypothetical protein